MILDAVRNFGRESTYATYLEEFIAQGKKNILVAIPHEAQMTAAQAYVANNVPAEIRGSVNVKIVVMNAHSGQYKAGDNVRYDNKNYAIIPYCFQ
jgi:hypothetical protein